MDLVIHTVMDIQALKDDLSSFESALLIYLDISVDVDVRKLYIYMHIVELIHTIPLDQNRKTEP